MSVKMRNPTNCRVCGESLGFHPGSGRDAYCPPPKSCQDSAEEIFFQVLEEYDISKKQYDRASQSISRFRKYASSELSIVDTTATVAAQVAVLREAAPSTEGTYESWLMSRYRTMREKVAQGQHRTALLEAWALKEFLMLGDPRACGLEVRLRCEGIISDVGLLVDTGDLGEAAVKFTMVARAYEREALLWGKLGKYHWMSIRLTTLGNLHRANLDLLWGIASYRAAHRALIGSANVAEGRCKSLPRPMRAVLAFEPYSFLLRLVSAYGPGPNSREAAQWEREIWRCAKESGSLFTFMEAHRESADLRILQSRSNRGAAKARLLDEAGRFLGEAERLRRELQLSPPWTELNLAFTRLRFESACRHLMEVEERLPRLHEDSIREGSFYHLRHWQRLQRDWPGACEPAVAGPPMYVSALLSFFYGEPEFRKYLSEH